MYFIGVTTAKSSIMKVFPEWAKALNLGDCDIKGMDFRQHDDPALYREAVAFIKRDPLSLGALVTTHKLDLLKACRDQFERLDPPAEMMHEISSVSKDNGRLVGHAKDPITSGLSLEAFLPMNHWAKTGAEVLLLGAGGSSIALSWQSVSGKTYTVQTATNLLTGFVNRQTNLVATPTDNVYTDNVGSAVGRFYRILIE